MGRSTPLLPPPTVNCPDEGTAATMRDRNQALRRKLQPLTTLFKAFPQTAFWQAELGGTTIYPGVYTNASYCGITAGTSYSRRPGRPQCVLGLPDRILSHRRHGRTAYEVSSWSTAPMPATSSGQSGTARRGHQRRREAGRSVGTIISQPGISVSTAGVVAITTINGRLIALGASTTLVNTVINTPAP